MPSGKPRPFPPQLERLRGIAARRLGAATGITAATTYLYVLVGQWVLSWRYEPVLIVPLILMALFAVELAVRYHSRMIVREYVQWLATNAPPRSQTAIAPPYERRPPVATATCMECHAQVGERHQRDCRSLPEEWFRRRA